nr:unnamed protein product [Digitaria exilis]
MRPEPYPDVPPICLMRREVERRAETEAGQFGWGVGAQQRQRGAGRAGEGDGDDARRRRREAGKGFGLEPDRAAGWCGPRSDATQGFPNRREPVRFDRFPTKPPRTAREGPHRPNPNPPLPQRPRAPSSRRKIASSAATAARARLTAPVAPPDGWQIYGRRTGYRFPTPASRPGEALAARPGVRYGFDDDDEGDTPLPSNIVADKINPADLRNTHVGKRKYHIAPSKVNPKRQRGQATGKGKQKEVEVLSDEKTDDVMMVMIAMMVVAVVAAVAVLLAVAGAEACRPAAADAVPAACHYQLIHRPIDLHGYLSAIRPRLTGRVVYSAPSFSPGAVYVMG